MLTTYIKFIVDYMESFPDEIKYRPGELAQSVDEMIARSDEAIFAIMHLIAKQAIYNTEDELDRI